MQTETLSRLQPTNQSGTCMLESADATANLKRKEWRVERRKRKRGRREAGSTGAGEGGGGEFISQKKKKRRFDVAEE